MASALQGRTHLSWTPLAGRWKWGYATQLPLVVVRDGRTGTGGKPYQAETENYLRESRLQNRVSSINVYN